MFDKLDTCALIIISILVISLLSNNGFGGCIKNDGVAVNLPSNTDSPPAQTQSSPAQVNSPPIHTQTPSLSSNTINGYSGGPELAGYNGKTPKLDGYAVQAKIEQNKTIKSDDLKPKGKTQHWDSPTGDYIADVLNKVPFQQSQSLRNASLDIRSEVANPQLIVSPWMQSTISPDLQKRGICA